MLVCGQKDGKLFWNFYRLHESNSGRLSQSVTVGDFFSAGQVIVESDYCVIILSLIHIFAVDSWKVVIVRNSNSCLLYTSVVIVRNSNNCQLLLLVIN